MMHSKTVTTAFSTPFILVLVMFLAACASTPSSTLPEGDFRERIQTQEKAGIRVSTGVPSAAEARELFGMPLYKKGIQPVWLKIENNTDRQVNFLPVGLDPQYFTPLEVANFDLDERKSPASLVDKFFLEQGMVATVEAGAQRSGFIFTSLDEGTKAFNVDIVHEGFFETFTFFIPVPGLNVDHYNVDWYGLYAPEEWVDLGKDELIQLVEEQTCCTTDKKGEGSGDPVNLVLIGHPMDIYTAFIRAGWDETETITKGTSWKTVKSFMSGGEYRYSPVSGLYVFGRPQDVAFQRARDNIHERNHLRLWMYHARFEGVPVWLGQISRDIGVRFTTKTITTHKIDPDVDETREFLLEDLAYAQSVKKIGYVGGVGEVSMDQPKGNLTGDPWFSDGYRLVLWVSSEPVAIDDIEALDWRTLYSSAD